MEITSDRQDDVLVVKMSGRLDAPASTEVKGQLGKLIESHVTKVVLDLEGLEYIGSAGLREFFLAGRSITRNDGKMALCNLQPAVKRIFDISGLPTSYPIYDTREEALQSMQG